MRRWILALSLTLGWLTLASADEWERMRIQKFAPRLDPPKVSLKSLDGKKVDLEDYKGKVVFLNFWTTWCGYCKREMPSMEKLYKNFKDKGFVILAVDVRESEDKVRSFLEKNALTFPVALDATANASFAFGVRGYPATFLVDRNGKIAGSASGAREWYSDDVKALISSLLNEKGTKVEAGQGGQIQSAAEKEGIGSDDDNSTDSMDLEAVDGPPLHSHGQITVRNGGVFDFDRGTIEGEAGADFSWSEIGISTRYLIPQNNAEFALKGRMERVTFDDIILSAYSGSPINGSDGEKNRLEPGTVLYARTNEGRFACFRIQSRGSDLGISWVTFEKD